jgi:hypothetical protein
MTTTALKPGTIVGPTDYHDPERRIRFGVVLAPDPSPLVRRIISDDPAIWRLAVAVLCGVVWPQGDYSYDIPADLPAEDDEETTSSRCDYCGRLFSIRKASVSWRYTYTSDERAQGVFTTGVYCSDPCAEKSASRSGSSRG